MTTVLYDGTFAGLMTAIFEVYERKIVSPHIRDQSTSTTDVFSTCHKVTTDMTKATRVWNGLHTRITSGMGHNVYACFLSREQNIENVLLGFARYVFSSERNIQFDYSDRNTLHIHQLARKVFREKHRMEAFVRFEKLEDDLYFSVIEPKYDVLPLIAGHFEDRYADQQWLIYDKKRAYGIYFDRAVQSVSEIILDLNQNDHAPASRIHADELKYQQLWQDYFQSGNIASGRNIKLHIHHVPVRYWKHLTEKQLSKIA
jgi:probable DNA metabolism protein